MEYWLDYFGYVCVVLSSITCIPQIISLVYSRDTSGISLATYEMILLTQVCWSCYGMLIKNIQIGVSSAICALSSMTVLILYRYFNTHKISEQSRLITL